MNGGSRCIGGRPEPCLQYFCGICVMRAQGDAEADSEQGGEPYHPIFSDKPTNFIPES